ncbi:unnamed protein product [Vitrella brassicaformis CCMP3155]|uniref:DUF4549 domain-containing protein n=1 Tax=Vitrella brassicaformis (strain CCMP3155) TaxID=1169540 RepID=A0A0G4GJZ9_VITBC|nr:unnamed protein product [Vitrella brassicaformis CCMP3155]|eukprot:CEM30229.1 unnamed protein product [Vitrella brassicaformis CCMP3155]
MASFASLLDQLLQGSGPTPIDEGVQLLESKFIDTHKRYLELCKKWRIDKVFAEDRQQRDDAFAAATAPGAQGGAAAGKGKAMYVPPHLELLESVERFRERRQEVRRVLTELPKVPEPTSSVHKIVKAWEDAGRLDMDLESTQRRLLMVFARRRDALVSQKVALLDRLGRMVHDAVEWTRISEAATHHLRTLQAEIEVNDARTVRLQPIDPPQRHRPPVAVSASNQPLYSSTDLVVHIRQLVSHHHLTWHLKKFIAQLQYVGLTHRQTIWLMCLEVVKMLHSNKDKDTQTQQRWPHTEGDEERHHHTRGSAELLARADRTQLPLLVYSRPQVSMEFPHHFQRQIRQTRFPPYHSKAQPDRRNTSANTDEHPADKRGGTGRPATSSGGHPHQPHHQQQQHSHGAKVAAAAAAVRSVTMRAPQTRPQSAGGGGGKGGGDDPSSLQRLLESEGIDDEGDAGLSLGREEGDEPQPTMYLKACNWLPFVCYIPRVDPVVLEQRHILRYYYEHLPRPRLPSRQKAASLTGDRAATGLSAAAQDVDDVARRAQSSSDGVHEGGIDGLLRSEHDFLKSHDLKYVLRRLNDLADTHTQRLLHAFDTDKSRRTSLTRSRSFSRQETHHTQSKPGSRGVGVGVNEDGGVSYHRIGGGVARGPGAQFDHIPIGPSGPAEEPADREHLLPSHNVRSFYYLRHLRCRALRTRLLRRLNFFRGVVCAYGIQADPRRDRVTQQEKLDWAAVQRAHARARPPQPKSVKELQTERVTGQTEGVLPNEVVIGNLIYTLRHQSNPVLPQIDSAQKTPSQHRAPFHKCEVALQETGVGRDSYEPLGGTGSGGDTDIAVRDPLGVLVVHDAVLADLDQLQEEILTIGTFFIRKFEKPLGAGSTSSRASRGASVSASGRSSGGVGGGGSLPTPVIDRCGVLLDAYECEGAYHEAKGRLVEAYWEIYEHTTDPKERRDLSQRITDVMAQRPRIDLKEEYFALSYTAAVSAMDRRAQLMREQLHMQIQQERMAARATSEQLDVFHRYIKDRPDFQPKVSLAARIRSAGAPPSAGGQSAESGSSSPSAARSPGDSESAEGGHQRRIGPLRVHLDVHGNLAHPTEGLPPPCPFSHMSRTGEMEASLQQNTLMRIVPSGEKVDVFEFFESLCMAWRGDMVLECVTTQLLAELKPPSILHTTAIEFCVQQVAYSLWQESLQSTLAAQATSTDPFKQFPQGSVDFLLAGQSMALRLDKLAGTSTHSSDHPRPPSASSQFPITVESSVAASRSKGKGEDSQVAREEKEFDLSMQKEMVDLRRKPRVEGVLTIFSNIVHQIKTRAAITLLSYQCSILERLCTEQANNCGISLPFSFPPATLPPLGDPATGIYTHPSTAAGGGGAEDDAPGVYTGPEHGAAARLDREVGVALQWTDRHVQLYATAPRVVELQQVLQHQVAYHAFLTVATLENQLLMTPLQRERSTILFEETGSNKLDNRGREALLALEQRFRRLSWSARESKQRPSAMFQQQTQQHRPKRPWEQQQVQQQSDTRPPTITQASPAPLPSGATMTSSQRAALLEQQAKEKETLLMNEGRAVAKQFVRVPDHLHGLRGAVLGYWKDRGRVLVAQAQQLPKAVSTEEAFMRSVRQLRYRLVSLGGALHLRRACEVALRLEGGRVAQAMLELAELIPEDISPLTLTSGESVIHRHGFQPYIDPDTLSIRTPLTLPTTIQATQAPTLKPLATPSEDEADQLYFLDKILSPITVVPLGTANEFERVKHHMKVIRGEAPPKRVDPMLVTGGVSVDGGGGPGGGGSGSGEDDRCREILEMRVPVVQDVQGRYMRDTLHGLHAVVALHMALALLDSDPVSMIFLMRRASLKPSLLEIPAIKASSSDEELLRAAGGGSSPTRRASTDQRAGLPIGTRLPRAVDVPLLESVEDIEVRNAVESLMACEGDFEALKRQLEQIQMIISAKEDPAHVTQSFLARKAQLLLWRCLLLLHAFSERLNQPPTHAASFLPPASPHHTSDKAELALWQQLLLGKPRLAGGLTIRLSPLQYFPELNGAKTPSSAQGRESGSRPASRLNREKPPDWGASPFLTDGLSLAVPSSPTAKEHAEGEARAASGSGGGGVPGLGLHEALAGSADRLSHGVSLMADSISLQPLLVDYDEYGECSDRTMAVYFSELHAPLPHPFPYLHPFFHEVVAQCRPDLVRPLSQAATGGGETPSDGEKRAPHVPQQQHEGVRECPLQEWGLRGLPHLPLSYVPGMLLFLRPASRQMVAATHMELQIELDDWMQVLEISPQVEVEKAMQGEEELIRARLVHSYMKEMLMALVTRRLPSSINMQQLASGEERGAAQALFHTLFGPPAEDIDAFSRAILRKSGGGAMLPDEASPTATATEEDFPPAPGPSVARQGGEGENENEVPMDLEDMELQYTSLPKEVLERAKRDLTRSMATTYAAISLMLVGLDKIFLELLVAACQGELHTISTLVSINVSEGLARQPMAEEVLKAGYTETDFSSKTQGEIFDHTIALLDRRHFVSKIEITLNFIQRLRSRGTFVRTNSGERGYVFLERDLNECVEDLGKKLLYWAVNFLAGRQHQAQGLIDGLSQSLMNQEHKTRALRHETKHLKTQLATQVNAEVAEKGYKLVFEIDRLHRLIVDIQSAAHTTERKLKDEITRSVQQELQGLRNDLAHTIDSSQEYRETLHHELVVALRQLKERALQELADLADRHHIGHPASLLRAQKALEDEADSLQQHASGRLMHKASFAVTDTSRRVTQAPSVTAAVAAATEAKDREVDRGDRPMTGAEKLMKGLAQDDESEVLRMRQQLHEQHSVNLKLRTFQAWRLLTTRERFEKEVRELRLTLTDNSSLWAQLHELRAREQTARGELIKATQNVSSCEFTIDRLKGQVNMAQQQTKKLQKWKMSKTKRLEELETTLQKKTRTSGLDVEKLLLTIRDRDTRLEHLERQTAAHQDQQTSIHTQHSKEVRRLQEALKRETYLKQQAIGKLDLIRAEMEMGGFDPESLASHWKDKIDKLEQQNQLLTADLAATKEKLTEYELETSYYYQRARQRGEPREMGAAAATQASSTRTLPLQQLQQQPGRPPSPPMPSTIPLFATAPSTTRRPPASAASQDADMPSESRDQLMSSESQQAGRFGPLFTARPSEPANRAMIPPSGPRVRGSATTNKRKEAGKRSLQQSGGPAVPLLSEVDVLSHALGQSSSGQPKTPSNGSGAKGGGNERQKRPTPVLSVQGSSAGEADSPSARSNMQTPQH